MKKFYAEAIKINRDFEDFLNEQKEWFCRYRCKALNLVSENIIRFKCEKCDEENTVSIESVKDCVCDNCPLDDFIWYIRDAKEITVE